MFNELDELKMLTQCVALESIDLTKEKEEADESDDDALIVDGTMDDRPYENGNSVTVCRVKGSKKKDDEEEEEDDSEEDSKKESDSDEEKDGDTECDGESCKEFGGSSGNVTSKTRKQKRPIFELDDNDDITDEIAEGIFGKGLGTFSGLGSLKKAMECCCDGDPDCDIQFHPGDYVKAKNKGIPVILIVKCSDGPCVTTAKPTNDMDEYCEGNDGCWPEFTFNQDEIEPMDGVSLNDIVKVMAFNDSQMESLTDSSIDSKPMEDAVDRTNDQFHCKKLYGADNCKENEFSDPGDLNEMLDDICGPMKTYEYTTPTITKQYGDGTVEKTKSSGSLSFGAW